MGIFFIASANAQQLINVDVAVWGNPAFSGQGVLGGPADTLWNGFDGTSKTNLVDSQGGATTMGISSVNQATSSNPGGTLPPVSLLFTDYFYSWGGNIVITLTGLDPAVTYHVVSYSVGDNAGQGANYAGAFTATSSGSTRASYVLNGNYVDVAQVAPDYSGTITIALTNGFVAWNGLQIQKNSTAGGTAPKITTQPANTVARLGSTTKLSVVANGGGLGNFFQWYWNDNVISNGLGSVLTITNLAYSQAGSYKVVVTNLLGSVTSQTATLTVDDTTTTEIFSGGDQGEGLDLTGNFVIAEYYGTDVGPLKLQDATFTFSATRLGVQDTDWFLDWGDPTTAPVFGTTTSDVNLATIVNAWGEGLTDTFNLAIPTSNGQKYKLQLLFHDGIAGASSHNRPISLTINGEIVESSMDPRVLGAQGSVSRGIVISYYFTGSGGALPIQIKGLNFTAAPQILNALTLQTLSSTPAQPYLVIAPQDQINALPGSIVAFNALAGGSVPPFNYQWSFNGTPLDGKTNATLILQDVSTANVGTYSVVASNSAGQVSGSAGLTLAANSSMVIADDPNKLDLSGNFVLAEYYANYNVGNLLIGDVAFAPSSRAGTTPNSSASSRPNFGSSSDQQNLATLCEHNSWGAINFSIPTVAGRKYKLQLLFHDNWATSVGQRTFQMQVGSVILPFTLDCVFLNAATTTPKMVAVYYTFTADADSTAIQAIAGVDNPMFNALTLEDITPGFVAPPTSITPLFSKMVAAGKTVQFIARYNGVGLTYHWEKLVGGVYTALSDGGNINGSTARTLTVSNISAADATTYRVTVSNSAGIATATAEIRLAVNGPVASLLGHWLSGPQNLQDTAGFAPSGTHDGTLVGATNAAVWNSDVPSSLAAPGLYSLDLSADDVAVSINNTTTNDASYVSTFDGIISNGFSVTCWAKGWPGGWRPFVSKYGEGSIGFQVRRWGSDPYACFTIRGTPGTDDPECSIASNDATNWHHYAATWDGVAGIRKLYVDNKLASTVTGDTGPMGIADAYSLVLGGKYDGSYNSWSRCALFDVRIYGYALNLGEITVVNNLTNPAPSILVALPDRGVGVGESTSFDANIDGKNLVYQWQKFDGTTWNNLTGKTSASLLIPSVALADAGNYRLYVHNSVGELYCPVTLSVWPTLHTLIGQWIDGTQGDLTDKSAFSLAGTHDGLFVGTAGNATWVNDVPTGFTGYSINFNGNVGMLITNSSLLDPGYKATFDLNHSFSVAFWAKGPASGWGPAWVSKNGESGGYKFRTSGNNNKPTFSLRGTPGDDDRDGMFGIDATNWHHFVGTWDMVAGVRKLYVDNVLSLATYNDGGFMTLAETNQFGIGVGDNNGYGAWFTGNIFDVRVYGYALPPSEIQTINKLASSPIAFSTVTSPQGLDLQGNFDIAEYYGDATGPVLPIGGVAFAPSTRAGGLGSSAQRPNFGPNSDQLNLGTLSYQSVWDNKLSFTVPTVAGIQYKLQLVLHDNYTTNTDARQFNVTIDGNKSGLIDLASFGANATNAQDLLLTYTFAGNGSPLVITNSSLVSWESAVLSAITLENLSSPLAAPALLSMTSQTNVLGSTVYLVGNFSGASLTYKWQKKNGSAVFVDIADTASRIGTATSVLTISNYVSTDLGDYKLLVSNTAGNASGIATVSLPLPQTPVLTADITSVRGQLTLTWTIGGLQSTVALNGTNTVWTPEPAGTSLSIDLKKTTGNKFYRVVNQ